MDERCVACGKGDNSIGHWMRWCPVPLIVGKIFLEDSHSATLQELAGKSVTAAVTVTHIVHQMRRMLLDFGGFRHASAAPHRLASWIQDLGSAVTQQLHPTLQVSRWPVGINPTNNTCCREHVDGIEFTAPLPLQITSATNQDLAGVAKSTVQPGDELGVLPVGHDGLHILQQTHPTFYSTRITPPANAELYMLDCSCDIPTSAFVLLISSQKAVKSSSLKYSVRTPLDTYYNLTAAINLERLWEEQVSASTGFSQARSNSF